MKQKVFLSIFFFMFLFFSSSCSEQKQLHDRLIVQGIGIDFENSSYKLTVDCFDSNSSNSEKGMKSEIIKSKGSSVHDALFNISSQVGESPLYSQNFVLLIGENAAINGINNIIDFFVRHYETRPNVNIFTVIGEAQNIMTSKKNGEPLTCENIEGIAKGNFYNARNIKSNILGVVSSIKNKTSDFKTLGLKIEENGQEKLVKSSGLAIFSDDKLKGFLDQDETLGAMLFSGKVSDTTKTISVKDIGEITFNINSSSSEVDIFTNNSNISCNLLIKIKTSIYEANKTYSNINTPLRENFNILEKEFAKTLESSVWKAINKVIWQYKSDIFDLGKRYLKKDPDNFNKISSSWKEILSSIEYDVKVSVALEQTGQEI